MKNIIIKFLIIILSVFLVSCDKFQDTEDPCNPVSVRWAVDDETPTEEECNPSDDFEDSINTTISDDFEEDSIDTTKWTITGEEFLLQSDGKLTFEDDTGDPIIPCIETNYAITSDGFAVSLDVHVLTYQLGYNALTLWAKMDNSTNTCIGDVYVRVKRANGGNPNNIYVVENGYCLNGVEQQYSGLQAGTGFNGYITMERTATEIATEFESDDGMGVRSIDGTPRTPGITTDGNATLKICFESPSAISTNIQIDNWIVYDTCEIEWE